MNSSLLVTTIVVGFVMVIGAAGASAIPDPARSSSLISDICSGGGLIPLPLGNYFAGWSCEEIVNSMGTDLTPSDAPENKPDPNVEPPAAFDWRTALPKCTTPVRNQGKCGSCWAFSSAAVLAHRFCIVADYHNLTIDVTLAPQDQVDCDNTCSGSRCQQGCNGGYLDLTWQFIQEFGITTESCRPYEGQEVSCRTNCATADRNYTKFQTVDRYKISNNVKDIEREIYINGPVQTGMTVYEDFLSYESGIYVKNSDKSVGGHAIKILGWGTENGVDYWICENSWGTNWGENGYFRIRKGTNEVGIESYVSAGRPKIDGVSYDDNSQDDASSARTTSLRVVLLGTASALLGLFYML